MKKLIFLTLFALCGSELIAGGTTFGKYAGEFLAIGVGGRPLGMGSAFAAIVNDATAGYWHPAGLSRLNYPQGILMHDERFGGLVNYDYGAVAIPYKNDMSLGISVIRLGVDGIPDTRNALIDLNGNLKFDPDERLDYSKITEFNYADWAFYFTFAKRLNEDFSYGANAKIIRRDIGDFGAWGIGFDVGLCYSPFENFFLGLNAQDITTTLLAWDTGTNQLVSPTLKLGTAYQINALSGKFTPAVDFDIRFENRKSASMFNVGPISFDTHLGLEYIYKNLFAVRAGYNEVKQFTIGAGIILPKLSIDYSFVKFTKAEDDLGDTHRISLILTLEEPKYKKIAE
ncbi:MAG: PorV/PorQ family protein [Ignavibacteria bacterium]|nr:PorV/PorQ family protein [Ignavibacteria bacterium]